MLNINIISVGKIKEDYLRAACDEYAKRLSAFCKLRITEIEPYRLPDNPGPALIKKALAEEGKKVLSQTGKNGCTVAMCIEGEKFSSEEFSKKMEELMISGAGSVDFIIGSSFGLSEEVKKKASVRMSMSSMTFPHRIARVMLLEQIYRAFSIINGGKYHK